MRQQESCEGACRERRLELVSGSDYDELTAAAAACRARIGGFGAVVGDLARAEPGPGEWRVAYEALQQSARSVLRRSGPAAGDRDDELPARAETVILWRCEDCGGVDAPQECIDVCIWGPADWVDAALYEPQRSRATMDGEAERSLAGLLRRFAFTTPRDRRAVGTKLACLSIAGAPRFSVGGSTPRCDRERQPAGSSRWITLPC